MRFVKIAIVLVEFILSVLYGLFTSKDGLTIFFLSGLILGISVLVSLLLVFIFRKNKQWPIFIAANGILCPVLFFFTASLTPNLKESCSHCYEFKDKENNKYTIFYNTYTETCEINKWIPGKYENTARTIKGSIVFRKDTMFLLFNQISHHRCEPDSTADSFWSIMDSNVYIYQDTISGLEFSYDSLRKAY